jgi:hypothetical protein
MQVVAFSKRLFDGVERVEEFFIFEANQRKLSFGREYHDKVQYNCLSISCPFCDLPNELLYYPMKVTKMKLPSYLTFRLPFAPKETRARATLCVIIKNANRSRIETLLGSRWC